MINYKKKYLKYKFKYFNLLNFYGGMNSVESIEEYKNKWLIPSEKNKDIFITMGFKYGTNSYPKLIEFEPNYFDKIHLEGNLLENSLLKEYFKLGIFEYYIEFFYNDFSNQESHFGMGLYTRRLFRDFNKIFIEQHQDYNLILELGAILLRLKIVVEKMENNELKQKIDKITYQLQYIIPFMIMKIFCEYSINEIVIQKLPKSKIKMITDHFNYIWKINNTFELPLYCKKLIDILLSNDFFRNPIDLSNMDKLEQNFNFLERDGITYIIV